MNLAYTHKIYDAVHGFIRFNDLERALIDSHPFQRLHYLHQLGISFLVYPGATHTRFEHSLGAMELSTRIFNQTSAKTPKLPIDIDYWRQVLRLSALCHDLGHLPFSHVAEKKILGDGGHEQWTLAVIQSEALSSIWNQFQTEYPQYPVIDDLIKTALGEKKCRQLGVPLAFSDWNRAVSEMLTGDFFGADRIDYLLRDAQCTGVSYGLFDYDQLIEMLSLLPDPYQGQLGIEENGIESCEALILARHFMHKRVYQYPSSKAYAFHLARFMCHLYQKEGYLSSLDAYLSQSDNEVMTVLRKAAKDPLHFGHADADALLQRHRRFKAIELPKGIKTSDVQPLQRLIEISSQDIDCHLMEESISSTPPSFSVLKRSGAVIDSTLFSSLLIPREQNSWVFVAPEHATAIQEAIERL